MNTSNIEVLSRPNKVGEVLVRVRTAISGVVRQRIEEIKEDLSAESQAKKARIRAERRFKRTRISECQMRNLREGYSSRYGKKIS